MDKGKSVAIGKNPEQNKGRSTLSKGQFQM